MKLSNIVSRILFIHFFIPILLLQMELSAQPVNPQPGENIWHLIAGVGTEVDQLALMQNSCCVGTFTALNIIESKIDAIVINSSCDLSGTYTLLNTAIAQESAIQSKLDECCFDLSSKIDTIQINSTCDLLGTYTLLNTAIVQEFTTQSKLDLCCATINSKVDSLTNVVNADFAGTFSAIAAIPAANFTGTYTLLNTVIAQEITTQSKVDLCCATINSKIDSLTNIVNADFAGTFSAIAAIPVANFTGTYTLLDTAIAQEFTTQSKLDLCCSTINSKVDSLTNIVNADFAATFTAIAAIPAANFTGTYTLLNTAIAQEFTTQSKLDLCCSTLNSKLDTLSGIVVADFAGTFTVLATSAGCNLSGTYTAIQALGQCNATPLTLTSAGTTITAAGVYCLTNNVQLGSSNSISINATDVVLDLNNKTVSGGSTSSMSTQGAIIINADRVTVKNGFMTNNGFTAITVLNTRAHANINNIQITNCSQGFFANGMNTSIFDNITFKNCSSASFLILGAINCVVSNCRVQGGASLGFASDSSSAIVFKNCLAESNGFGFSVGNPSGGITLDSCVANNCTFDGFLINFTLNQDVKLINCIAQNCVNGFNISTSGTLGTFDFKNCQAVKNSNNGFILSYAQTGLLEDCSAVDNANAGFIFNNGASVSSQIVMNNCQANSNGSHGFDLSSTTSCSLNYCTASNNGTTSGSGFNLNSASTCSITNCQAENNTIDGFDGSLAGACCIIGNCIAASNTSYGFIGNSNVTFFNNFAQCNTPNFDDFSASSAASGMLDSKVDTLTNIVNADFAGTFTVLQEAALCSPMTINGVTTISVAGTYCLARNFAAPTGDAITINASDVVLDLNNKTINGTGAANGVHIMPGVARVVIKNGHLYSMANNALFIDNANQCSIFNCDFLSSATGLGLVSANDNVIENNKAILNTFAGYSLVGSSKNSIKNCQAIDTISTGNSYGFISSGGAYNIFDGCLADSIQTTATTAAFIAASYMLTNSESCSQIINCQADNTSTPTFGFSVPYGIVLDGETNGTISFVLQQVTANSIANVKWAPNNQYLAASSAATTVASQVNVYKFNGYSVNSVASATLSLETVGVFGLGWSPDSQYLAIGTATSVSDGFPLRVYRFDGSSLTEIPGTRISTGGTVRDLQWSPNGQFLAVEIDYTDGSLPQLQIYQFNGTTLTALPAGNIFWGSFITSVSWSPDGSYLAIGAESQNFDINGAQFAVYSFDGTTLTQVPGSLIAYGAGGLGVLFLYSVAWSPDGTLIAAGGQNAPDGYNVRMISFDGTTATTVASGNYGTVVNSSIARSISWSNDSRFISASGMTSSAAINILQVFNTNLILTAGVQPSSAANLGNSWSSNGQYIAFAAGTTLFVYSPNSFGTSHCLIQNNSINCTYGGNSTGVGIASFVTQKDINTVLNNTVFQNDTNFTNIAVVPNDVTSLVYNVASCSPISLSQSNMVNNTLILTATGNSYCLSSDVIGNIIITSPNISINLNSHSLIGTFSLQSSAYNALIENGRIQPPSPLSSADAATAGVQIDALADKVTINNCYIICADSLINNSTGVTGGINGRNCVNAFGNNAIVRNCILQSGGGGLGRINTTPLITRGGQGGIGINVSGSNTLITQCNIKTGAGGNGGNIVNLGGQNGGAGGNGGIGINNTGINTQVFQTIIQTGNGGIGGNTAVSANGGNGGNGGVAINSAGSQLNVSACTIAKTGSGGAPGTGTLSGTIGSGGDGIVINGATFTDINNCMISNTGTGLIGGYAINDMTTTATEAIYSNFAFNIAHASTSYLLAIGAAIDSPNGTTFGPGVDKFANVHKP